MLEGMLQLVAEVLLQALTELLIELGLHAVAESFERRPSPGLAAVGYAIAGALLGGVSLWLLPQHLTATPGARLAAVVIVPLVAGGLMAALGAWRARRGDPVLRIDRFSYGYLFALCFALMRYFFAT
ncbi:hypothetical protein J7432_17255 [Xanthomonas axonopodis pv. begoniae]|uniref:hypothetical protein n=1 Tax=Xanthomonas phaseoli TaxID=1985254 RepID=UPI000CEE68DF|nr:hypothetical protein [Xanthomonas phaseoli]MBO9740697.1 hypothetical protein [Xanthomonas axonopodis pv. begoniae]MBO9773727.1 hypothetical protein [Xanthomonas axonopodis pv. begoniae]MCC8468327.1 hypothetical protein [Xanthomonas phaseoli]PPT34696.1 hypothetical protein XabCFBP2524_14805 [Xanthomonas axonopodis pv. begoniae]